MRYIRYILLRGLRKFKYLLQLGLQAVAINASTDIHDELDSQAGDISSSNGEETTASKTNGKATEPPTARNNEPEDEDGFLKDGLNKARAHWIQLYKINNLQNQVVQYMFINMIRDYPQIRPVWQFSRRIDTNNQNWALELTNNIQFRHHCTSVQSAMTVSSYYAFKQPHS